MIRMMTYDNDDDANDDTDDDADDDGDEDVSPLQESALGQVIGQ